MIKSVFSNGVMRDVFAGLGLDSALIDLIEVANEASIRSCFPVSDLASASFSVFGAALVRLNQALFNQTNVVKVDQTLASAWFGFTFQPIDFHIVSPWDTLSGDYATKDGWIRVHTNAKSHRLVATDLLGLTDVDERQIPLFAKQEILRWKKFDLENALVENGGCAAAMVSRDTWLNSNQGSSQANQGLVNRAKRFQPFVFETWRPTRQKPLAGMKILDMTRVLAGPVCTRILSSLGANVLRIDPPSWNEPGVSPEVNVGKRCAHLDLKTPWGKAIFAELLDQADVFVHGLRPGALDGLGFGPLVIDSLRDGVIDVSLSAFSESTPWASRRGFDSLVQMSSGIADHAKEIANSIRPVPLPVQALDHATGYFMATEVLLAILDQTVNNLATRSKFSLVSTADLLAKYAMPQFVGNLEIGQIPFDGDVYFLETTPWGKGRRMRLPLAVEGTNFSFPLPSRPIGYDRASW